MRSWLFAAEVPFALPYIVLSVQKLALTADDYVDSFSVPMA